MRKSEAYDAVVVGAGPNGLAAAITLAQAGYSVKVIEAETSVGGGTRTAELTLPGYLHDVCAAIHPLSMVSPFLRQLPLADYGLEWAHPPASIAHPLDGGDAVLIERSIGETAAGLGPDGAAYRRLVTPLVERWQDLVEDSLGGVPLPPKHPFLMARFGMHALQSAVGLSSLNFRGVHARAVFAGNAAHSMLPLDRLVTAGFGLVMSVTAHAVGWPLARGGSHHITRAMAEHFCKLGGEIELNHRVEDIDELPPARAVLFDVTPRQLLRIAGKRLPDGYRQRLGRFRYGVGVFKIDFALAGPIPWENPRIARSATVHVGGSREEIAAAEGMVWRGEHPERPFVLLAQQTLFDPSRAPENRHTAWAYCHVPHNSTVDMSRQIEAQIERFAPGFRDLILARHTYTAAQMESYNPNYVGGDINGGVQDIWQFFTRPVVSLVPYATPAAGVYLCSSSTPPGGGVHGMCGYNAAQAAARWLSKGSRNS